MRKKATANKPSTPLELAQEKELNEIAALAERLRLNGEAQKDIIKAGEQVINAQKETIALQRRQLALQAGIFAKMFTATAQLQEQMQTTLEGIQPAGE